MPSYPTRLQPDCTPLPNDSRRQNTIPLEHTISNSAHDLPYVRVYGPKWAKMCPTNVFDAKRVELAPVIRNAINEAKHWLASFCTLAHYPPKILGNHADKCLPQAPSDNRT